MKRIHVFNPVSGIGHSPELLTKGAANGEESYITTCVGDAERFAYETCCERGPLHFVVYGGDGTINEVASGILRAGMGNECLLSVVPSGTGNDFVRSFPDKNKIYTIDVLTYNGKYAVNIINFGFDSKVVTKTDHYKKIFPGRFAYLAGVAECFCRKIGEDWKIEIENEKGDVEALDREFILALAANCRYYGGGFHSASIADPSDGYIDFIAVNKLSRAEFIGLIGDYKKGNHLDPKTCAPYEKFQKYITFRRCKKVRISGIKNICADGEITDCSEVEIGIIPSALRIAT